MCPTLGDVLVGQINQNLIKKHIRLLISTDSILFLFYVFKLIFKDIKIRLLSHEKKRIWLYLSQKAFVFGEQTSAVLHGDIQSPPVELHEGNAELEP